VNYTGISVGFGWTATANAMSGNRINYNDVNNIVKILADGGGIYTLSNQGSGSQMEYNYIHDFQKSQWADYGDHGLYLDEQTSGYTVSHNVLVNCPAISTNHPGTNTMSDNAGTLASTISGAGIEPAYVDIKKNLMIPIPAFASSGTGGQAGGACGNTGDDGGTTSVGGSTGSGGSRNTGGTGGTVSTMNSGGAPATGGTTSAGGTTGASSGMSASGTTGASGATSIGGGTSAGGAASTGSATNAGGVMSAGGATDSGGAVATGVATSTNGATSTAGATPTGGLTSTGTAPLTSSSTNMGGNLAGTAGATASSSSATSATASSCSCGLGGKAANPRSRDVGSFLLGLAWVGLHWRRRGANTAGLAKHLR